MLDRRASLIFAGAAAGGLVLGAGAWAAAGGPGFAQNAIAETAAKFPTLRVRPAPARAQSAGLARALAAPLFSIPGAGGPAPALRLDGVARTPTRIAALLSMDGKPAEWLAMGETRNGVTLVEVGDGKITVDTSNGSAEVVLGQVPAVQAPTQDAPPSGFRMPPPPASAPTPRS
ncbi:MAG: hypothetical protein J7521_16860 [Caulobacter sp.]|nr:hypothetical protein [Caulobacter sp.]